VTLRARLESRLNHIWYREGSPPWYLRLLTPLYRLLFAADRWLQKRNRASDLESRCIIVVGNLTVGGSGKTPLLIRLCQLFRRAGLAPAVISRGYGRDDRKQRLVIPSSNPELVGDEPLLIAKRSGVPVMVAPGRSRAARELFARGAEVVISDDGLQHHALPRAIEICVVDGKRGFGNGHLLPAGPLRESPARLQSCNHVIINGGESERPSGCAMPQNISVTHMELHPGKVYALHGKQTWRLSQFAGCKVSAVAGIANPGRFFDLLRQSGIDVQERPFPDHHNFSAGDFEDLPKDLPIIMTEKDAVKCSAVELKNAWYLSVDAHLPGQWEQEIVRQARQFIERETQR
jgi:tetraacyldisaccharide 4'-kinase